MSHEESTLLHGPILQRNGNGSSQKGEAASFHKKAYRDTPGNAEIERLVAKLGILRMPGKPCQSILITSALQGEGKSTVAANIGQSLARNNKKPTLLIDFDIRRPRQHQIFGLPKAPGMVDILSTEFSIKDCFKSTSFPNLLVLTSGEINQNPTEILKSDHLHAFFDETSNHFGHIVIDSPPVLPVSDPLVLSKFADNVLVTIRAGHTHRQMVKQAIDMLRQVEADVDGIVLNNVDNVLPMSDDYSQYEYDYYEPN